jgi:perosamine synthetase
MIPVNEPSIGEREIAYVLDCMRTGWISSAGRYIEEFESSWAAYCGRKFGVAVSNGTVALEIAVRCLDLKPGDEVILPSFTIVSCVQAIIYAGGVPVLVDSEPRTWCMDVSLVEAKVTPRTRAIMPVHIYGHPVDMDPILSLADRYGLAIIEDAAEAHGAEYLSGREKDSFRWRRCGSFGRMSCFSFYANKIITTGEGGMILTDDPDLAERLRSLRNLCFQRERRFFHEDLGYNFRLTNLQAAIGLAQLERIEELIQRKRWMATAYTERLCDLDGIQLPVQEPWARNVYWMYGIVLNSSAGLDAAELARRLREAGVDTRPFFLGMHEQPVLNGKGYFRGECYPVAERLGRYGLYLPSGMTLTEAQVEEVCAAVRSILNPGKDHWQ